MDERKQATKDISRLVVEELRELPDLVDDDRQRGGRSMQWPSASISRNR